MFQPVAQAALSDHLPLKDFIHGFSRNSCSWKFFLDASLIGYIFAINGFTVFLFQIQFMPMLEFYSVFLLEKYLYCHSRKQA